MRARAYVPSLLAIGLVVSVISSLGAPLIPSIAGDLGSSLSATQWSLTATLLVGAVASPVVGRLGDGPHRRTVLLVCLAIVTLGGALAALATTLPVLVAGRAMQGLGLALMPLTMASARDHLPAERAGSTIALLSVIGAAGVGLGYPITGFIAEYLDSSAAFWFGAVASGLAFAMAAVFVPSPRDPAHPKSLDVLGAALIGAGLIALLLALEKGADWGWGAPRTAALLALAVVLLALWTRNELRVDEPLVELRLVRRRSVLTANVTGLVLGVAMYLGISLMTQIVQLDTGIGQTVFVAGLTLVPFAIVSALSSRLLPVVQRRTGRRATIPIGASVIAASMIFFGLTGDALWEAFVTMGVVGLGLGFTFAAMPGLIVGSVPQHETSSAMSFYQVTRYVGFSIGSGLAVTLLRAFDGDSVPDQSAYSATFLVGAALCLLAAVIAWVLPGDALDRVAEGLDEPHIDAVGIEATSRAA
ncbi:MAG TPA: MFS transporter [Thermoleophilaceae bacterium]|nr:MFS transporter [Thermoleophilaceae bacterium]